MALADGGRAAKGKRPEFHDDGAIDRLISMIVALTAELATVRQRLAIVERVGIGAGAFDRAALEDFDPTPAEFAEDEARRMQLLRTVFHHVNKEMDDLAQAATAEGYESAVARISADR